MGIVTIQCAEVQEAELIAAISRQTFFDTFAGQNTKENMDKFLNEQFRMEMLVKEVGKEGNIFLLAKIDSEIAGYAFLRETENPREMGNIPAIEVARIYATQKNLGKGIGAALMDKCIEIARGMQKKLIWLCVWEHNLRAIDFYKKKGFERFGSHVFLLGDDPQNDWMMKKNLS
jgi:ribosomal protein S18 acetylase RimI-like enzyme